MKYASYKGDHIVLVRKGQIIGALISAEELKFLEQIKAIGWSIHREERKKRRGAKKC